MSLVLYSAQSRIWIDNMSSKSPINVSVRANVATIELSRPERWNALNVECRELLLTAIERIEGDDDIRAAILTGKGRAFCSGQDLAEACMNPDAEGGARVGDTLDTSYRPLVLALYNGRKPFVCAVNGDAIGGGVSLALACDIVVAARSASFVLPYCRLGLAADAGVSYFLPQFIARARALGLLLLGERIDAETAQQWGLIWRTADDGELLDVATSIAAQLARGPTAALAAIKTELTVARCHSLEQQLDHECDMQRVLERTKDYREGLRAILEKRQPDFRKDTPVSERAGG